MMQTISPRKFRHMLQININLKIAIADQLQNATIEERVSLLEIQVVEIQEDVTEVDERVELLEGDVNFLFDEQVIQDERLLGLENRVLDNENDVEGTERTTFEKFHNRLKS